MKYRVRTLEYVYPEDLGSKLEAINPGNDWRLIGFSQDYGYFNGYRYATCIWERPDE